MSIRNNPVMRHALLCVFCVLLLRQGACLAQGDDRFTIATANLSSQTGITETCYLPCAGRIFQGVAPDVLAIQEFNVTNNGQYASRREFVDLYFGTNFHYYVEPDSLMPNGIISRWPILDAGIWDDPELYDREFAWATIQLPADRLLHVISLHLKAGDGSTDIERRIHEAHSLTSFIASAFSPTNFIALCGDFNLVDRAEMTLHILTNDFPYTYTPRDQEGYKNTNKNREYPFDWVMAAPLLNHHAATTTIAGVDFPEGAIFDSRLWETPPAPIQTNDSIGTGIQHMLVMRTFSFTETTDPPDLDTLALYTFEENDAKTNSAAQTQDGVTASTFGTSDGSTSYLTGDASKWAIRETGWNTYDHYFTFTISIDNGYQALIDSLQFNGMRGSTGPTRWSIRSSTDNFASDLGGGDYTLADSWSLAHIGLGLDLISGDITFRIYGYDAATSSGNWRIDNVSLSGSMNTVEIFRFSAFALTNSVVLRWTLPVDCGMPNNKVRIVHKNTDYPTNTTDGTAVDIEDGSTAYHHTSCTPGVACYYTIWLHDGTSYVEPPGR